MSASEPLQVPTPEQLAAFEDVHVRVTVSPTVIVVGFAAMLVVTSPDTVSSAVAELLPPGPLQVMP